MSAVAIVRDALASTGLDLIGSCSIAAYDRRAPLSMRAASLMPSARGVIVVGSAGGELWRTFREALAQTPSHLRSAHPLDAHVARALDRADDALALAGIANRRFEPTLNARPALNFQALGELVGLGSQGPFGLLIHETHGPWWALRGTWLVDAEVDPPNRHDAPCAACSAPCVGGRAHASGIVLATAIVRSRCVVGVSSRYEDEQIAYHYDHERTLETLRTRALDLP